MITLVNLHLQNASSILVPNGSISFTINVDATVIAAPYGFVSSAIPVVFQLDANGNILPNSPAAVAQIWSNLELSPQNSMGLGTYYEVQILDQNGARLNQAAMYWQFIEAAGSTVDISTMTAYAAEGNVIYYPVFSGPSGGFIIVPYSATPVFNAYSNGNFQISLTGNVTSSTLINAQAGVITIKIIQSPGGGNTFAWPANFVGAMPISPTAESVSVQSFLFDGTNAYAIGPGSQSA